MNITVVALNIFDGMKHHENWELLQPAWESQGMGFVEFCLWLSEIAEAIIGLQELPLEHPGVWEYEVAEPLGGQIVTFARLSRSLPTKAEVVTWAQTLHNDFIKGD